MKETKEYDINWDKVLCDAQKNTHKTPPKFKKACLDTTSIQTTGLSEFLVN
jgi:hypothetical protein